MQEEQDDEDYRGLAALQVLTNRHGEDYITNLSMSSSRDSDTQ